MSENQDALDCGVLINRLESRLFQEPDSPELNQAFERAILLCHSTSDTDMSSAVQKSPTFTEVSLELGGGYHSNPSMVASYDQIELDFDGTLIYLPNQEREKPAAFQRLDLGLTHKSNRHKFGLNMYAQKFNAQDVSNRLSVDAKYYLLLGQKAFTVSYSHMQEELLDAPYGYLQFEGVWMHQNHSANVLKIGRTFYPFSEALEGSIFEFKHLFKPLVVLSGQKQGLKTEIQSLIGAGVNIPVRERAGDTQLLLQVSIGGTTIWSPHEFGYGTRVGLTQDSERYSTLLAKNSKRNLINVGSYLKWRYLGFDRWVPGMTISYVKQESNVDLFDWQFWSIELSTQIKW